MIADAAGSEPRWRRLPEERPRQIIEAAPDKTATASAHQVSRLQRRRKFVRFFPPDAARNAGSATSTVKKTVPAASSVAAMWTARVRTSGSSKANVRP